jgi:hypothetical protein
MSPRTSSVSDKSKKSVSPRHTPNVTSNILPSDLSESKRQSSISATMAQSDQHQTHYDPHAAKVARLETATSLGYGTGTTDIPPKIEESTEPD